jgi:glycerophosphoryl diester phosphodiesterase
MLYNVVLCLFISCLFQSLTKYYCNDYVQSYWEITSDTYLDYIKQYVVGIGPSKDTILVPLVNKYVMTPSDLVARAHAHNL